MLVTDLLTQETLKVQFKYSRDYIDRIRQIRGATFIPEHKYWTIPRNEITAFEELFQGEIVWKTPRWKIRFEPMPDMSKMYHLPDTIQCPQGKLNPYSHQEFGVRFMIDRLNRNGFVINSDDVGIGKTLQAILTMQHMVQNENVKRLMIACKKSIKGQWKKEIEKFSALADDCQILIVDGSKAQRRKIYQEFGKYERAILIINYHLILHDTEELEALGFEMMVADEVHEIKSRMGKLNAAVRQVVKDASYMIFLTGTPIMSRPDDIFGVIQIANPYYFGKWTDFKKQYINEEYNGHYVNVVGYRHLDDLRDKVQEVLIRRTEHEVAISLPSTVIKRIDCEMDKTQHELLKEVKLMQEDLRQRIDKIYKESCDGKKMTEEQRQQVERHEATLKALFVAEQAAANDPRLFSRSKSHMMRDCFSKFVPATYKASAKTEAVYDVVEEVLDAGEKIIIFSKFETCVDMLANDLERRLKKPVLTYSGRIKSQEREQVIEKFTKEDDYAILIGTDAMAEGLNLAEARHVLHYEQPDTPAIKTQRNGRSRRASSNYQTVFVYDVITEHSRDIQRLEHLEQTMGLVDGVVSVDEAQSKVLKEISERK